MKKITVDQVLDLTEYEKGRSDFVARMIELKTPRRVAVGDQVTFIFENDQTALFQIQEMVRAERLVDPDKIRAEVDVYNEFVPGEHELRATMMIEILDRTRIRAVLDELIGIDEHVFLEIGAERVQAGFDPKQFEEERISAVQYVRFELGPELARGFCDPGVPVRLRLDHPRYGHATAIEGESRVALIGDLRS